jgi:hypothetical protein
MVYGEAEKAGGRREDGKALSSKTAWEASLREERHLDDRTTGCE